LHGNAWSSPSKSKTGPRRHTAALLAIPGSWPAIFAKGEWLASQRYATAWRTRELLAPLLQPSVALCQMNAWIGSKRRYNLGPAWH